MLGIIILYNKIENKFSYWYAGLIFALSLGILCEIVRVYIAPTSTHKDLFDLLARFLSALSYRFCAYFALLAGIETYYEAKNKTKINVILLTPVVLGFMGDIIYPETGFLTTFLDWSPYFWTTAIWGAPYLLVANVLMILAYIKESSPILKPQKLLATIIVLPTAFLAVNAFLIPWLFKKHIIEYNLYADALFFVLFIIFVIRYGIMGVKISLEKMKIDASINVVSSGTMILFHAFKNELTTISINSQCLDGDDSSVASIKMSADRILTMIQCMNAKLQNIEIKKKPGNIAKLINEILESLKMPLEKDNITVVKNLKNNLIVDYDSFYFKEALTNIIKNAIEAIKNTGTIEISSESTGKYVVLRIKDTGSGISKENMSHIFDPFFSTKKNIQNNYGLGLTSSYKIIQQHKGFLEISSKENKGTTVIIWLPK